jgi:hypothetical protein
LIKFIAVECSTYPNFWAKAHFLLPRNQIRR